MSNSEYKTMTIKEAMKKINKEIFLPPIQRNFVWSHDKIICLFDSLMRGFPIGTFLFWKISAKRLNDQEYTLYEFIRDYNEITSSQNEEMPTPFNSTDEREEITAVLDGQQRLNSLYLSLQGTIISKKRGKPSKDREKEKLYFNLHSNPNCSENVGENDPTIYKFKFMSDSKFESIKPDKCPSEGEEFWFKVRDVINAEVYEVDEIATKNKPSFEKDHLARKNLSKLISKIVQENVINYFEAQANFEDGREKFTTLDEIADIFVRVNYSGERLEKTDLLFSRIVTNWPRARKEYQELVKKLNEGRLYKFDNDFITKACLMAIDKGSKVKADALTDSNIKKIIDNWDNIKNSILDIRNFLRENGIVHDCIESYNSLLPLVLFRYRYDKKVLLEGQNALEMKRFVVISQVEHLFGVASNFILDGLRNRIYSIENRMFPDIKGFRDIKGVQLDLNRNMIREWFNEEKGKTTRIILTLLYESNNYNDLVQDHMHPAVVFEKENKINSIKNVCIRNEEGNLIELSNDERFNYLKYQRNTLANLQLLTSSKNGEKKDKPLISWLADPENKKEAQCLPSDCSYELDDFEEFMQKRQKLMEDKLCEFFGVE